MKIYIGADHAGFVLKEKLKKTLAKKYSVVDLTPLYRKGDDYPDVAKQVGKKIAAVQNAKGILICGSAEGICIAANKVKRIRAVAAFNEATAKLSRLHNDANILCLSGGQVKNLAEKKMLRGTFLTNKKAAKIALAWLSTKFSGEKRHLRRIEKIKLLEKELD